MTQFVIAVLLAAAISCGIVLVALFGLDNPYIGMHCRNLECSGNAPGECPLPAYCPRR